MSVIPVIGYRNSPSAFNAEGWDTPHQKNQKKKPGVSWV